MSEWKVEVVRVGAVRRHENADTLSIMNIHAAQDGSGGYPVVVRTGEFKEGDLAVYVPVDSLVPEDSPRFAFLSGHRRIKAKRLRGVFSMGLLVQADPDMAEGENVTARLGVTKWEPADPAIMAGENEQCPFHFPHYTDVEGLRRHGDVLVQGEDVVVTEKIHGCNARFVFSRGRLWCGSHHGVKKESDKSLWWRAARRYDLAGKLERVPDVVLFGEVYGQVQDLRYGAARDEYRLAFFDAFDIASGRYRDYDAFDTLASGLGLPMVPVFYRGPWSREQHVALAEGPTTVDGGAGGHVREGIVVRPTKERFDERVGRVILKLPGEGYLTRKEKGG